MQHLRLVAAVVLALAPTATACSDDEQTDTTGSGNTTEPTVITVPDGAEIRFYESPGARATGEPGELLDTSPIVLDGIRATGQRIIYGSTTPRGDVVHVTGVLMVPDGDPPEGGRPVAVWGHPTVGVGTRCAPSLVEPFPLDGAQRLLDAGFIVAAPDYDGLGSEGTHPYLVGESEGRAMLDIARAAGEVGADDIVVTWGHSQGGHAGLWARSIAGDYAPELDLRATAAAAPPTDLAAFLDPGFESRLLLVATAQTALAWSAVYENAGLDALATPVALSVAADQLSTCITDLSAVVASVSPAQVWAQGPDEVPGWHALTTANSVDAARGTGPVFLSHGGSDNLVPLSGTTALADALCATGETVALRVGDEWSHGSAYTETRTEMLEWLIAAGLGESLESEC